MAAKSLVNDEGLIDGVDAAVVAVVPDPPAVVAELDDFFELLQPSRPTEATIATDIKAARLRGTDMLVPPYMEIRLLPGDETSVGCHNRHRPGESVGDHPKNHRVNKTLTIQEIRK
jgi:hypothetical protein